MVNRVGLIAPAVRVEDAFEKDSRHLFRRSGGNTGNFAFVNALFNDIISTRTIFPWEASVEEIREQSDVIVFAAANQLGVHSDLARLAAKLEAIDLPIVVVGIGAQANMGATDVSLSAGTRRWLEVVADHSFDGRANLGARGAFTADLINRQLGTSMAIVTGCPSNFTNTASDLAYKVKARLDQPELSNLCVCAGLQLWGHLKNIEQNLVSLIVGGAGDYVVQSELGMIQLARREFDEIGPDELEALRAYILPSANISDFISWCVRHAICFKDATSWMEYVRRFDFVVGARFHGVMLAFQAGVPGLCIAHDSRTLEMCETMGIPVIDFRSVKLPLSRDTLREMVDFNPENYSIKRRALCRNYTEILSATDISLRRDLYMLTA